MVFLPVGSLGWLVDVGWIFGWDFFLRLGNLNKKKIQSFFGESTSLKNNKKDIRGLQKLF